jgi:CheY-like chemotaxis protein
MLENVSFLYVEDDPRSRQVMSLIMTKAMGVQHLTIFEDSVDFEAHLKAIDPAPNIILLDVHVQPYDGFAMLDMVRQNPELREVKVIALTASVMNEEVQKLRTRGFDGAIGKPLSVAIFPGLIERIVAGEAVWHVV